MAERKPDTTIGLIPCAVGGTGIAKWMPGTTLFERAVERTRIATQKGRLKGILWHQGEGTSGSQQGAASYASNLTEVIAGFRKSFDSPEVPFVAGELGEFLYTRARNPYSPLLNQQINSIPDKVPNTAVVPSKGLGHRGDQLHFDADSLKEFGKRYFETFLKLAPEE